MRWMSPGQTRTMSGSSKRGTAQNSTKGLHETPRALYDCRKNVSVKDVRDILSQTSVNALAPGGARHSASKAIRLTQI